MAKKFLENRRDSVAVIALLIALSAIALYLIGNKPAPIVKGSCVGECESFITNTSAYPNGGFHSSEICGKKVVHGVLVNCFIEDMEYIPGTDMKSVKCTCCVCIGSAGSDLGECQYGFFLFDWLGSALKLCKMGG